MGAFEVHRRFVVEGRVTAMAVVPRLDVVEDLAAGHRMSREAATVEHLTLGGDEEALAQGVVEAVAPRTPRRPHSGLPAPAPEGQQRILAPLVRVMNHRLGTTRPEGHVQLGETPKTRHRVAMGY